MGPMLDSGGVPASPRGPRREGPIDGTPDPDHATPLSQTPPVRDAPRAPADLLPSAPRAPVLGDPAVGVASVVYRSADVEPGALFFAVPGTKADGHDFAEAAERAGAVAVVVERRLPVECAQVVVPSVRA